jgi:hypothetical protein
VVTPHCGHGPVQVVRPFGASSVNVCPFEHVPWTLTAAIDRGSKHVRLPDRGPVDASGTVVAMANTPYAEDVESVIGQRLTRACALVEMNEQALADARDQRDQLIIEAVDDWGWTQYRVARHLGISERMVHKVLSRGGARRLVTTGGL